MPEGVDVFSVPINDCRLVLVRGAMQPGSFFDEFEELPIWVELRSPSKPTVHIAEVKELQSIFALDALRASMESNLEIWVKVLSWWYETGSAFWTCGPVDLLALFGLELHVVEPWFSNDAIFFVAMARWPEDDLPREFDIAVYKLPLSSLVLEKRQLDGVNEARERKIPLHLTRESLEALFS